MLAQREKILLMVKEHFSVVGYSLMQERVSMQRQRLSLVGYLEY